MDLGMKLFTLFFIFGVSIFPVHCSYYSKTKPVHHKKEKETRLQFYVHDILSGKTPSAVPIAHRFNHKDNSTLAFGNLFAFDDILTVGPQPNSTVIGNGRGLYLSASQNKDYTIVMYADFAFTSGKFNGSSFSVASRNPITDAHREMAVVGGRGKFRMCRGFVEVKSSYINYTNGDAILQYKATLLHY